jgi:hypothetical protein
MAEQGHNRHTEVGFGWPMLDSSHSALRVWVWRSPYCGLAFLLLMITLQADVAVHVTGCVYVYLKIEDRSMAVTDN